MTSIQPQHLVYRGVVQASGIFFDTRLLSTEEGMRRILRLWTPGAAVFRLPIGLLLRLPVALEICCEAAPGLPLVAEGGLLLAAPLGPDELRRLHAPPGAAVLTVGGNALVRDLVNAAQEDPAAWLDVAGWRAQRPNSLGVPPAPPQMVAEPEPFDPRAKLKGVPPEAPDRVFVLEALRKAAQGEGVQGKETDGVGTKGGLQGDGPPGVIGKQIVGWLRRLIGVEPTRVTAQESDHAFGDAAHRLGLKLLQASGLAKIIGRRQAEYIGRMMEMFERGDLNEALRHAIPMGEMDGMPKPSALGVPKARPDLTITLQRTPARSAFHLDSDFHEHLKAMYRKAFHKLEAEGRIDEAAFVLAELLGADEEAVAYLERHKRFKLAAEMAEARKLTPGLVVRQWFLAGEAQRAVLVARRTGAFADAVIRLEWTDVHRARELRMLWANALATAGDYANAMEAIDSVLPVIWQDLDIRQQVGAWIDAAIALGGPAGAQLLARKLVLFPERSDELRGQVLAMLADEGEASAMERTAFAYAVSWGESTPLTKSLARAAARSVLRDVGAGYRRIYPGDQNDRWKRLLRFAEDGALRADLPVLSTPPAHAPSRETPLRIQIAATDAGLLPIYDAALLPNGRCILALGEAGLRLITPDGRTVVHADQPAHRLVVSDHGSQVIALAPRGDVWRMVRMNLITRRVDVWREAALRAFAPDYDGSLWFVAIEKDLLAIDATAPGFDALWRLPNLEGSILSIARSKLRCSLLLFSAGVTDTWGRPTDLWTRLETLTHSLPDLFLRERKELTGPPPMAQEGIDYARTLLPDGQIYHLDTFAQTQPEFETGLAERKNVEKPCLVIRDPSNHIHPILALPGHTYLFPTVVCRDCIVLSIRYADGVDCRILDRKTLQLLTHISFAGAEQVTVRPSGDRLIVDHLAIADERGRLLVFDLTRNELLRDLRLH